MVKDKNRGQEERGRNVSEFLSTIERGDITALMDAVSIGEKQNVYPVWQLYTSEATDNFSKRLGMLLNQYLERFGDQRVVIISSPGRAELLGNFQDNDTGGVTLSAGITKDVLAVAGVGYGKVSIFDMAIDDSLEVLVKDLPAPEKRLMPGWHPFVLGVARTMKDRRSDFNGLRMVLHGEVPDGGGCSSSAAFENSIGCSINQLYGYKMSISELAEISKIAENDFKGKGCGFLDQMTSLVGKIVFLEYKENGAPSFKVIEAPWFNGYSLMTVMADKDHSGTSEDYNGVKKDFVKAKQIISHKRKNLIGDSADYVCAFGDNIPVETRAFTRGLFYNFEYDRVNQGVIALANGNASEFGRLINKSGEGSRYMLKNTTPGIDAAVELANKHGGYARVHGGGFGGGILIMTKDPEKMREVMSAKYGEKKVATHGIRPGVCELVLDY